MAFVQFQHRHDTMTNWNSFNPVLAPGEIGLETDTSLFKIGNGTNNWKSLPYGGTKGSTGSIGATGYVGYISTQTQFGSTGRTGTIGPTGPASIVAGPLGSTGPSSNTGATGSVSTVAGPTGPTGTQGPIGPQGPAGPVGALGPAGEVGPIGPIGPQGPVGPAGPDGVVGPVGPAAPSTTSLVTWGEMSPNYNFVRVNYDMTSQPNGTYMLLISPKVVTTDEGMWDTCFMCILFKSDSSMDGYANRHSNGSVTTPSNYMTFNFTNNEITVNCYISNGIHTVDIVVRNTLNTQGATYAIIRIG